MLVVVIVVIVTVVVDVLTVVVVVVADVVVVVADVVVVVFVSVVVVPVVLVVVNVASHTYARRIEHSAFCHVGWVLLRTKMLVQSRLGLATRGQVPKVDQRWYSS